MKPEAKNAQKLSSLKNGNAMSGAPIISGIRKLPNTPMSSGMMTKNTMTVACMVTSML